MNALLSDRKVAEWKSDGPKFLRKVIKHSQPFQTTPDKLFPLLCPTTELDWLDGWHCELIYSRSLYQEYNLIFKTNYFNMDEVWVTSHFEPNRALEFVRVSEHVSAKVDVRLCDNLDGTTTGDWIVIITALTSKGNEMLSHLKPDDEPMAILLDALDHYIDHHEIKPIPDGRFNKKN